MKKIILLLIAVATLSTGCKKDYTCICKANGNTASTSTIHATKSTATSDCNSLSSNGNGLSCSIQ